MSRYTWEFQKDFLRKTYNKEVNEWFKDLPDFDYDINTPRKAVKSACLIKPNDTQTMVLLKMKTFREIVQRVQEKPEIFGFPCDNFREINHYLPTLTIYFREDLTNAKLNNRQPIRAQISIRYKGDVSSQSELNLLSQKIENIFFKPRFSYDKGKIKYCYIDREKGYNLVNNFLSETDAKALFNKVLEIQGDHPLDPDNLIKSELPEKNWLAQPTKMIGGVAYKKPKMRLVGKVYYYKASFCTHEMKKPIWLHEVWPYDGTV